MVTEKWHVEKLAQGDWLIQNLADRAGQIDIGSVRCKTFSNWHGKEKETYTLANQQIGS